MKHCIKMGIFLSALHGKEEKIAKSPINKFAKDIDISGDFSYNTNIFEHWYEKRSNAKDKWHMMEWNWYGTSTVHKSKK